MKKLYNKKPRLVDNIEVELEEWFLYQYLPIKFPGQTAPIYEKRLAVFDKVIGRVCCDFVGNFGLDKYVESYIYLTAKHQYQRRGNAFNRPGWHSDGFGSDDISYIWSNFQPTIFNSGDFLISEDDEKSMEEMELQAAPENNFTHADNSILCLDQFSVHKVGEPIEGNRGFLKLCFSKDIYALKGNSINHELQYQWRYRGRHRRRNVPCS